MASAPVYSTWREVALAAALAFGSGVGIGAVSDRLLLGPPFPFIAVQAEAVDGDTLRLTLLAHIDMTDAPELDGRCHEERQLAVTARDRLDQLLHLGQTRAQILGEDQFGRISVRVVSGDRPLAEMMVSEHLAKTTSGRAAWCPGENATNNPVARMLAMIRE